MAITDNVLTALAPTLYSAAQTVSAEPFGVVDAISATFDDKGVALGDSVKVPVAPTRAGENFTPAATADTGAAATADSIAVTITKSRKVSWALSGEQLRSLENGGNDMEWARQLAEQGMRTLRNEAEADAALAIKYGASRAYGTAGQTPFAADLTALTNIRKILKDNGAPLADLQFVMDTSAELNLSNLGIIQQAYQAGSDAERRSGMLGRQFGFALKSSAGIALHDNGSGASYITNIPSPGTLALKSRTIGLDGGTGTIVSGDVITFNGDTNKYVVNTALTAGDLVIGRPGLRKTLADGVACAVGADYTPNMAFERSAVVGVMRPPLVPSNPTINQMLISDGKGMTYLMLDISQYGQRTWEIHLAWGFKVVQGEHVALVLG